MATIKTISSGVAKFGRRLRRARTRPMRLLLMELARRRLRLAYVAVLVAPDLLALWLVLVGAPRSETLKVSKPPCLPSGAPIAMNPNPSPDEMKGRIAALEAVVSTLIAFHPQREEVGRFFAGMIEAKLDMSLPTSVPEESRDALQEARSQFLAATTANRRRG